MKPEDIHRIWNDPNFIKRVVSGKGDPVEAAATGMQVVGLFKLVAQLESRGYRIAGIFAVKLGDGDPVEINSGEMMAELDTELIVNTILPPALTVDLIRQATEQWLKEADKTDPPADPEAIKNILTAFPVKDEDEDKDADDEDA